MIGPPWDDIDGGLLPEVEDLESLPDDLGSDFAEPDPDMDLTPHETNPT